MHIHWNRTVTGCIDHISENIPHGCLLAIEPFTMMLCSCAKALRESATKARGARYLWLPTDPLHSTEQGEHDCCSKEAATGATCDGGLQWRRVSHTTSCTHWGVVLNDIWHRVVDWPTITTVRLQQHLLAEFKGSSLTTLHWELCTFHVIHSFHVMLPNISSALKPFFLCSLGCAATGAPAITRKAAGHFKRKGIAGLDGLDVAKTSKVNLTRTNHHLSASINPLWCSQAVIKPC